MSQRALCGFVSRANMSCILTCLRVYVSCVVTFQRVFRAYLLMCQHDLRVLELTCQRTLSAYVPRLLIYSCSNVSCELTFLRANVPWVLYLIRLVWTRVQLPNMFAFVVSSFDISFFSSTAILVKVVYIAGLRV